MKPLIPLDQDEWIPSCACETGVSHIAAGQPCQDAAAYRTVPYGMQKKRPYTVILAVADGAGSAERSGEGSQLAVNTALDIIESELRPRRGKRPRRRGTRNLKKFLNSAFTGATEAIEKKAKQDGADVRQYATTLLIAIAVDDVVAAGQTGDGAIVARIGDQEYRTLIVPQRGRYRNETTFITEPDSVPQIMAKSKTAVNRIALFTDGLEGLVIAQADGSPHAPFFDGIFRWIEMQNGDRASIEAGLTRLLNDPKTRNKTHDDLSIAVACRPAVG